MTSNEPFEFELSQVEEIENSAIEFVSQYIETLEGKDEASILALLVDDGRFAWFTDGKQSYSSPEEVIEGMRRYAEVEFRTTLSEVNALALGERLVAVSSKFETHLTIPESDDFNYGGVITWILERDPSQASWRVVRGHTSTSSGPPER